MAYEGKRTRLRAVEPGDADAMFRWMNDPEVTEHLAVRFPISMEAERRWAEAAPSRAGYRNVVFAIERREDRRLLGSCGLHGATPEDRVAALGVNIGEKAEWGQGYGYDALRTLLCFGFREMNLRRVELRVDEDHARGRALYERLGFQYDGWQPGGRWTKGRPQDLLTMSIGRAEFDERYGATGAIGGADAAGAAGARHDVPRR